MPPMHNPPWMLPGDPGWRSGSPTPSDASYDSMGQPRWGGVGQGAPLDENGRYIYSQMGMPIVASPGSPSLSAEVGPQVDENSLHHRDHTDDATVTSEPPSPSAVTEVGPQIDENSSMNHGGHTDGVVVSINRASLKRRFNDVFNDSPSLPQTPRRFGGSLNNTPSRARTMRSALLLVPSASKRRRLRTPFNMDGGMRGSHKQNLENAIKEMHQIVSASLAKQTEVLVEILKVMRKHNPIDSD